ncbi:unnamed protein product [Amoebophrya sp. A120]|nr:unnamed protein product [Amoebophrya sp. A120]|eukprot:GSA120T00023623001.1
MTLIILFLALAQRFRKRTSFPLYRKSASFKEALRFIKKLFFHCILIIPLANAKLYADGIAQPRKFNTLLDVVDAEYVRCEAPKVFLFLNRKSLWYDYEEGHGHQFRGIICRWSDTKTINRGHHQRHEYHKLKVQVDTKTISISKKLIQKLFS